MTKEEYVLAVGRKIKEVGEFYNFNYMPVADDVSLPANRNILEALNLENPAFPELKKTYNNGNKLRYRYKMPEGDKRFNIAQEKHSYFYDYDVDNKQYYFDELSSFDIKPKVSLNPSTSDVPDTIGGKLPTEVTSISLNNKGYDTQVGALVNSFGMLENSLKDAERYHEVARPDHLLRTEPSADVDRKKDYSKFKEELDAVDNVRAGEYRKADGTWEKIYSDDKDDTFANLLGESLKDAFGENYLWNLTKSTLGGFMSGLGLNVPGMTGPEDASKGFWPRQFFGYIDDYGNSQNILVNQWPESVGGTNPLFGDSSQFIFPLSNIANTYKVYQIPWFQDGAGFLLNKATRDSDSPVYKKELSATYRAIAYQNQALHNLHPNGWANWEPKDAANSTIETLDGVELRSTMRTSFEVGRPIYALNVAGEHPGGQWNRDVDFITSYSAINDWFIPASRGNKNQYEYLFYKIPRENPKMHEGQEEQDRIAAVKHYASDSSYRERPINIIRNEALKKPTLSDVPRGFYEINPPKSIEKEKEALTNDFVFVENGKEKDIPMHSIGLFKVNKSGKANMVYQEKDEQSLLKSLVRDNTDMFTNQFVCWLEDDDGKLIDIYRHVYGASTNAHRFVLSTTSVNVPQAKKNTVQLNLFGRKMEKVMECSSTLKHESTLSMSSDQMLTLYRYIFAQLGNVAINPETDKADDKKFTGAKKVYNLCVALWTGGKIKEYVKKSATHLSAGFQDNISSLRERQDKQQIPFIKFKNIKFLNLSEIAANPTSNSKIEHKIRFAFEDVTLTMKEFTLN